MSGYIIAFVLFIMLQCLCSSMMEAYEEDEELPLPLQLLSFVTFPGVLMLSLLENDEEE